MNQHKKEDETNIIFEMMLQKALDQYAESNGEKLNEQLPWIDNHIKPEYSKSFIYSMDNLLKSKTHHQKKQRGVFSFKLIAVCISIILLATICVSADKLIYMFTSVQHEADHVKISNNTSTIAYPEIKILNEWDAIYLPEKLPAGYKFDKINFNQGFVVANYMDLNGNNLTFVQFKDANNTMSIDTENSNFKEITIDSNTGYFVEQDNTSILIWTNNVYSFQLKGRCTEKELTDITINLNIFSK